MLIYLYLNCIELIAGCVADVEVKKSGSNDHIDKLLILTQFKVKLLNFIEIRDNKCQNAKIR